MAKLLVAVLTGITTRSELAQGFRRRPQHGRARLSHRERIPTLLMVGNRHPGDRQTVLKTARLVILTI